MLNLTVTGLVSVNQTRSAADLTLTVLLERKKKNIYICNLPERPELCDQFQLQLQIICVCIHTRVCACVSEWVCVCVCVCVCVWERDREREGGRERERETAHARARMHVCAWVCDDTSFLWRWRIGKVRHVTYRFWRVIVAAIGTALANQALKKPSCRAKIWIKTCF